MAGFSCSPQLADLPDQKLWRIDPRADYGPLQHIARGRIALDKIERHWDDICRIIASIHTGATW
ncbi:Tn3 family transposase [Streptosporangium sp. NPDC051022]|uniref:Tn3 family transposase n=1 Tax=Streptosporangium sp. NPDC051022 TaxID=3155752 RepID=UPI00341A3F15